MHEQNIWRRALSGFVLMVAITLGWILTFDSGLLTSFAMSNQPVSAKSGVP